MSYLGQTDIIHLQSAEIRVLHVDDQRDIVELSSEFLERESDTIEVVTETTVQDGLHRLASERIDCIVSDYDMPGCDGLEFLEHVREDHGDIPFILYTGKGSEEIASKAISTGVTDYLQKETGTDQYTVLANRVENAVEQYRSQRAVKATEQKLSQIAEQTDDILFMFNDEWNELLFINSAYEDVWGGSISELRDDPRSFLDYVHPDDRDIAGQSLERLQRGESDTVEYRVITDDGDQRWVRGETKPILDDSGELLRITGFVRDITDQKEHEQELQARASAMEAATDGIAILGEDQEYVYMNEAHAEIYGYDDPNQLLGESWRACYEDGEITRFESEILPKLVENGLWHGEMTVTAADGQTIHQDLTLERLDDGRILCSVRDITEQREREQELEQYKILVEEATDSIGVVSEDGTVQYQNPAIEGILGYDRDAFEGTTVFEYMHPDDRDDVVKRFHELVTDGSDRIDRVQYRIQHADGSWRWLESEAKSQTDTPVDGYVIITRDITERREREQELKRYEKIYETIDDGVYVVDEEGQFVMVNEAYAEMFGYDRPELLGAPVSQIVDEDVVEQAQQLEAAMRQDTADTPTIEAELPTSDGDQLSLEAKLALLPGSDDQVYRVGVVRNISERKAREQELEREKQRFQTIFEQSNDAIFLLDPENDGIEDVNPRAEELLGYTREEFVSSVAISDVHPDKTDQYRAFLDRVQDERSGRTDRFECVSKGGEKRYCEISAAPLDIEESQLLIANVRDITERKEYEQRLERQNERLEEFASVVSHDLRNPLNVAQGQLELLREDCDSGQLDSIERAHTRMHRLIEDLLTLSREGNVVTDTEAVELSEMAANCWANVKTDDASLVIDTNQTILTDKSRLKQVFENLMRNATEHGGETVTVTVGELTDGFYIEDDGSGIPPSDRSDVFEAGYSTNSDGTGFGLRIIQQIVEAHDWTINLTDGTEGGARFEITGVEFADR